MDQKKKIFISDIHMGTAESIQSDRPYGWLLKDRAELLTEFLDRLSRDRELSELIIVGDLFDEWVVPYTTSPVPTDRREYVDQFFKIAAAPQNKPIIKALCNLADTDGIQVTYVPGNHDMLMKSAVLAELIPNIRPLINGSGKGIYTAGKIAAEHGSYYCLFNAPDTYDNPGHNLPLGFFVARSQAEGVTTGHPVTKASYVRIILDALNRLIRKESFADAIFESIVDQIRSATNDIVMQGMDAYPKSVRTTEISYIFKELARNWEKNMPGNVSTPVAVLGEMACLFPAVFKQYAWPYFEKKKNENIVVLGHTHAWEIKGVSLKRLLTEIGEDFFHIFEAIKDNAPQEILKIFKDVPDPGADAPSDFIYANSGTWIDGDAGSVSGEKPPATYVEIKEAEQKTVVGIYSYTGGDLARNRLLDSRFTVG
jgi:UDP-2,3-diacylglucosamine pyrophosphatase LpxH